MGCCDHLILLFLSSSQASRSVSSPRPLWPVHPMLTRPVIGEKVQSLLDSAGPSEVGRRAGLGRGGVLLSKCDSPRSGAEALANCDDGLPASMPKKTAKMCSFLVTLVPHSPLYTGHHMLFWGTA
ncbi:unnamed protein product [Protopolystoma xenopodis]|uniref:Uncharacterized protein n=1 Tax=Protopolystoma xenopodis TaxID=117903 RepID=A0A448XDM5_9PLAT|nr:unnamed protein product [Protopolystoma xenopodis]